MADDGLLRTSAPDRLIPLFEQAAADMARRDLTRFADGLDGPDDTAFRAVAAAVLDPAIEPVECLLAAAAAGLFPSHQPPADLPDDGARNRYLLRHLERCGHRVRPARADDLPALVGLERRCWAPALRTPKAVLAGRIARYPQGQLALLVDGDVVGVIYSQRIARVEELNGITVAQVDSLHDADAGTVQLLAVNILPEMQHRALGDQLLEFMLTYRSLQPRVDAVVAITLCRNFDAQGDLALEDYIRLRNAHGVLSDPILRFHELHGAAIERVMPGYRPADRKNDGCGVLVRYDIRRRGRKTLPLDAAPPSRTERPSRARIRADVQSAVSACLGRGRRTAFAFDRPLMEMGLDSADILELGEAIAQRYRLPLPPAFFFQYNTTEKIAGYLCERFAQDAPPATTSSPTPKPPERNRRDAPVREQDVAIIGMACRLPGGIHSPDEFWAVLRDGVSVIGGLPADRWRWPDGIDPAHRHRGIDRGGFLDEVAAFDAPFFRVSPAEAESMDPQQRMLLELSWQAIENAGYAAGTLAGSRTGVFIGASGSDYARLLDQSGQPAEAHYGTGSSMAVLANRISYFFDFLGPSLLIDTACSSSLVAVHEAVQAIRAGEAAQALVGGINLILHPANSIAYYKAGMLSKDGLCRTFDQQANGYARGEGAVVLLLKPLRAALADGDRVHAVIKGTACNHGGQASGLTVPNPEQQGRLLQAAWRAAGIDPTALSYIEAHGTGTPLGDPIEVQGIRQAMGQAMDGVPAGWRCGLGSVKTNLGHLEAAAGLAGLLKVVLCLRHRTLPASLHFRQRNQHIGLDGSGLYVVDHRQDWTPAAGAPRLAGISSFGSGGTNAHAVVAEFPVEERVGAEAGGPVLFVLSARTPQRLRDYARRYADWLGSEAGAAVPLGALARLLQTGRQAMEERLALVVSGHRELIDRLNAFHASPPPEASGRKAAPAGLGDVTRGDAGQAFVRALMAQGDLDGVAALWQAGADVDWSLLHGGADTAGRPPRVEAPT
ncbi:MAG TPA: type I polyketide synthase, partial [Azospirillum sp.]